MTLNIGDSRNEYTATSAQTIFNYTFKIYDAGDLDVYVTPAGQACSPADLTTAYSVSGVGNTGGGTITLVTPTSVNDLVTIVSAIPGNRTTDYQNNGDFRPDTVDDDFDRVGSLVKQADERSKRSLSFHPCQQGVSQLTLPAPVKQTFLRWKSDLSGLENVTLSASGVAAEVSVSTYSAMRSLTSSSYTDGQVIVLTGDRIAGIFIVKTGSVTDNSGTRIVFTDDINRYAERVYHYGINVAWFGAVGDGATDDYASLVAAQTEAGSTKTLFFPAGDYKLSTSLVFTSGIEMEIDATFVPDSARTVTISGPLKSGPHQVFSGSGSVSFGTNNSNIEYYPVEWFGVLTSNSDTVNDTGMSRMSASVPTGATIRWGNGNYTITDFTWPDKRWTWIGSGSIETTDATPSSTLSGTSGSSAPTVTMPFSGVNTSRFSSISNMRILTGGTGTALFVENLGTNLQNVYLGGGGKGGHISHATDLHWIDVYCKGSSQGLYIAPASGKAVTSSLFTNVTCVCGNNTGDALSLTDAVQSGSIAGNTFVNIVAQTAHRGIVMVGSGAIRNTFINPWTEALSGSTPKALEDVSSSNSFFINPDFRDNRSTVPVTWGASTTRFDQSYWTLISPIALATYTVATVPSAVSFPNGAIIVSDEIGGRTIATSDGSVWRRVSDGAVVS